MNSTIITVLLLVGTIAVAQAQQLSITEDTLQWSVNGFQNLLNDQTVSQNSIFKTNGSTIEWNQNNGAKVYTFTITGTQGTWPNLEVNGEIVFTVNIGSRSGTIKFYRETGGVKIQMNFPVEGKNVMPYRFQVQQIVKL